MLAVFALTAVVARKILLEAMARAGPNITQVSRVMDLLAGTFIIMFASMDLIKV
ncbi:hypothetical protein [uncultured Roseibium sp.]|uniref:hypothetical protein n=1 Tax=uncultured Roseibium sp. TaxID=1936171 RepID=UPI00262CAC64|nr:hypothetical protein [uncultured Roseibium sp.]